jgi:hypothetical protein
MVCLSPAKTSQFVLTEALPSATTFSKPSVRLDTPASPFRTTKEDSNAIDGSSCSWKVSKEQTYRHSLTSPYCIFAIHTDRSPSFSITKARDAALSALMPLSLAPFLLRSGGEEGGVRAYD